MYTFCIFYIEMQTLQEALIENASPAWVKYNFNHFIDEYFHQIPVIQQMNSLR